MGLLRVSRGPPCHRCLFASTISSSRLWLCPVLFSWIFHLCPADSALPLRSVRILGSLLPPVSDPAAPHPVRLPPLPPCPSPSSPTKVTVCVCVCVCVCARACVRACVCVCSCTGPARAPSWAGVGGTGSDAGRAWCCLHTSPSWGGAWLGGAWLDFSVCSVKTPHCSDTHIQFL